MSQQGELQSDGQPREPGPRSERSLSYSQEIRGGSLQVQTRIIPLPSGLW